jgi:sec-independent protein translocase protein TatB
MLDIGFLELLLVFIVALLVIGPKRMPEAVRAVLSLTLTLTRSLHNARREVERQIGADDIRRQLHNEEVMRSLNESKAAIENAINETGSELDRIKNSVADAQSPVSDIDPSLVEPQKTAQDKTKDQPA